MSLQIITCKISNTITREAEDFNALIFQEKRVLFVDIRFPMDLLALLSRLVPALLPGNIGALLAGDGPGHVPTLL